jgi:hypothetical protein
VYTSPHKSQVNVGVSSGFTCLPRSVEFVAGESAKEGGAKPAVILRVTGLCGESLYAGIELASVETIVSEGRGLSVRVCT